MAVNFFTKQSLIKVVFLGMISVVLLGTGNVAQHLFDAFEKSKHIQVKQVLGRSLKALDYFKEHTEISDNFDTILTADVYIVAISDDAINTVNQLLKNIDSLIVHTSGSVSIDQLNFKRTGVFYPLQTLSKGHRINFREVPICIEAKNGEDLELLHQIGSEISNKVLEVSSEQRLSLHVAAVLVNNFTNHLYHMANLICNEQKVPFSILEPLILETSAKISELSPYEAQTGPAKRSDNKTMQAHISLLQNPLHKEIYELISTSIKHTYGEKL